MKRRALGLLLDSGLERTQVVEGLRFMRVVGVVEWSLASEVSRISPHSNCYLLALESDLLKAMPLEALSSVFSPSGF